GSLWYELSGGGFRYSTLSLIESQNKKVCSLNEDEQLIFQLGVISRLFNGASLEKIDIRLVEKKPDSFWSGWKTSIGDFCEGISYLPYTAQNIIYATAELFSSKSPSWYEYQHIIHPAIMEASIEILNSCSEERPKVVEICGGEGELGLSIGRNHKSPMDYYLLEFNQKSLENANYRFENATKSEEIQTSFVTIKTDVTDSEDYYLDTNKKQQMQSGSIDLIIGSGALTSCVLEDQEAAFKVARKCYQLLKPNGKMILSGHAHSLLSSKNFESIGFTVLNSTLAGNSDEPFTTDPNHFVFKIGGFHGQFYILEKRDSSSV
ncbi:MAG: class I SAM-dependent methyltransferase, partial [Chlamydiota bacterium]